MSRPILNFLARNLSILSVTALLTSCGVDDPPFDFDAGEFEIFTLLVDDQCLDGGLDALFMPLGTDEPWRWPHAVDVFPPSELPRTYDLNLREPFGQMEITAEPGSPTEQQLLVHPNPSVLIGPAQFGDCVIALEGSVYVELTGTDRIEGVASLTMSDPRGDERCPADMPPSCPVLLSFEGNRL